MQRCDVDNQNKKADIDWDSKEIKKKENCVNNEKRKNKTKKYGTQEQQTKQNKAEQSFSQVKQKQINNSVFLSLDYIYTQLYKYTNN